MREIKLTVKELSELAGEKYTEREILTSYKGRCISDKESLKVGYLGSCGIEIHRKQMQDPESWVHISFPRWIATVKRTAVDEMYEAIEAALAISDLWTYPESECPENPTESQALSIMKSKFEAALAKARGELTK